MFMGLTDGPYKWGIFMGHVYGPHTSAISYVNVVVVLVDDPSTWAGRWGRSPQAAKLLNCKTAELSFDVLLNRYTTWGAERAGARAGAGGRLNFHTFPHASVAPETSHAYLISIYVARVCGPYGTKIAYYTNIYKHTNTYYYARMGY